MVNLGKNLTALKFDVVWDSLAPITKECNRFLPWNLATHTLFMSMQDSVERSVKTSIQEKLRNSPANTNTTR